MLIVHVVTFGHAIPVLHVLMTNKKEWLHTRVLEWLQNKCPNLSQERVICDFEIGMLNSKDEWVATQHSINLSQHLTTLS
jgi:hypothetical protein